MSEGASERVKTAQFIAAHAGGEVPYFHWAEPARVFAERQMRLRQRAQGHAMGDFLRFMAELSGAQHEALQALAQQAPLPLPGADALAQAALAGLPPLPAADWPRAAAWRQTLRRLVQDLRGRGLPAGVQAALDLVQQADDDTLEAQADGLLNGVMQGVSLAMAPLVAAALQVYWTHLVQSLRAQAVAAPQARADAPFQRPGDARSCPCCGSRPTASLTRSAGGVGGQRYLHCSLCSTQWALPRLRCAHCMGAEPVYYQALAAVDVAAADSAPAGAEAARDEAASAAQAAVQAECCDACGHYLKIVHADRDPLVEPVADDLASLTLDLLVAESGLQRHGVNLMLLFGEPEPEPGPRPGPQGEGAADPPRAAAAPVPQATAAPPARPGAG